MGKKKSLPPLDNDSIQCCDGGERPEEELGLKFVKSNILIHCHGHITRDMAAGTIVLKKPMERAKPKSEDETNTGDETPKPEQNTKME